MKEKLLKEKEDLEERLFYIKMVDRWTKEEYEYYDELTKKIKEIEKKLEELK